MKKIKNIFVFSDGSYYSDYSVVTSVKFNTVYFNKVDYKNSILYTNKPSKNLISKHSKEYKKKFFY